MNATSLFVSTSRVVLQAQAQEQDSEQESDSAADLSTSSWADLHRLVPYLRQALSCTVCANLLVEPYTPRDSCQHHVCSSCRGGRKRLKPSCSWCKDYGAYAENVLLRILLQCYKKLCAYITSTAIYRSLLAGGSSLVELINEGAEFKDDYKSSPGLSRSAYSILPCVYSNSSQPQVAAIPSSPSPPNVQPTSPLADILQEDDHRAPSPTSTVPNGSSLYSVYNIGSKMTFKRKTISSENEVANTHNTGDNRCVQEKSTKSLSLTFKKPHKGIKSVRSLSLKSSVSVTKQPGRVATLGGMNAMNLKRKGCRCGNATATPGKLTCCGQRCPCYVDSKACLDCRCKGCRNPHRPGGHKVRPHIPELESYQLHLSPSDEMQTIDEDTPVLSLASPSELAATNAGATVQVLGVYTTQLHPVTTVSTTLPAAILVDDESGTIMDDSSEIDTSDVEIDC
ncbi:E3 ubiquitin-protein ligase MSL2 [Frankliniella fusca]|uniref:E3 ubiquitin-protein ligase MSL2 n=1 Tax=Frankliniella fusca TaxID=407009 RepID=A0AAE1LKP5_9NEOP|nr:E3 ubiquitin-protein ligase MSL2 [Frankliniella fusca]